MTAIVISDEKDVGDDEEDDDKGDDDDAKVYKDDVRSGLAKSQKNLDSIFTTTLM